jgi:hypothetical protein
MGEMWELMEGIETSKAKPVLKRKDESTDFEDRKKRPIKHLVVEKIKQNKGKEVVG